MASISPRKSKKTGKLIGWQVKVRRKGYPDIVKTFQKKGDAEAWARSEETSIDKGQWQDRTEAESTTLYDALVRYIPEAAAKKKGAKQELAVIQQWQKRPLARRFLSSIQGKDIAQVVRDMEAEGKGPATIRRHLAVISHLFRVARTEWGMSSLTNPVELIRKPKLPQGRDRRLMADEEERLLKECRNAINPWLLPVVVFAIETAMRAGEMLETKDKKDPVTGVRPIITTGLFWEQVDMEKCLAFLPETKNGDARTVPLSRKAVEVLNGLPRMESPKVFDTTYEAIHLAFVRACKRAGIEGLDFHDLRHEAASRLFEKGLNPMEAATVTGHKTLQMLKRYTHLRAEDLVKRLG